jgi:hypothetical protein
MLETNGTPEWVTQSIPLWEELSRIKELEAELKKLTAQKEAAILALQNQCKHPKELSLDGDSVDSHFGGVLFRPMRVCRLCGYAEEGWGAGYWKLSKESGYPATGATIPSLSHDEAWKHVRTFVTQDQMTHLGRYGEKARLRAIEEGE